MERLLKELIQIEKKRNSLLTDIANSLTDIASKEKSEIDNVSQAEYICQAIKETVGKANLTI